MEVVVVNLNPVGSTLPKPFTPEWLAHRIRLVLDAPAKAAPALPPPPVAEDPAV